MIQSFKQLDQILRGQATRLPDLRKGQVDIPVAGISFVILLLAVIYGLCMGSFAMIRTGGQAHMQLIAGAVKLPLLFFLTLVVTFPSLYVFNALVGSNLSIRSVLKLLIASQGVMLAVVASLGPIVVFFSVSTTSYSFMVMLNVVVCTVAGALGLAFMLRTMQRLLIVQLSDDSPPADPPTGNNNDADHEAESPTMNGSEADDASEPAGPQEPPSALDRISGFNTAKAKAVIQIWLAVFALVGAQMSWVLRPFIGHPNMAFSWFRAREGNFFLAVLRAITEMFSS